MNIKNFEVWCKNNLYSHSDNLINNSNKTIFFVTLNNKKYWGYEGMEVKFENNYGKIIRPNETLIGYFWVDILSEGDKNYNLPYFTFECY